MEAVIYHPQPQQYVNHNAVNPFNAKHLIITLTCLYILLASSASFIDQLTPYDEKRLLQCFTLFSIFIISWLFAGKELIQALEALPLFPKGLLAALLFLGLLSAIFADNTPYAFLEISFFTLLFLCILCLSVAFKQSPDFFQAIILITITALAAIQFISTLSAYFSALTTSTPLNPHDLFLNYSNIRFFNQIQSWTLPLIVLPLLINKNIFAKYAFVFASIAIAWWFLLFTSGSRGTMLAMIIALIASYLIFKNDALKWLKLQFVTLIGGLFLYFVLIILLPLYLYSDITSRTLLRADSPGRIYLWQRAWELIQESPLLGTGPMGFACDPSNFIAAHPHNAPIQLAVEWGMPAALIAVTLFLYGLYHWVKKIKATTPNTTPDQTCVQISLFASLVAAACHALLSGVIVMPLSQTMMVLVIGWMMGIHFSNTPHVMPSKQTKAGLALISLFCIILVASSVYHTFPNQEQAIKNGQVKLSQFIPRFWQQGKLCTLSHTPIITP